MVSNALAAAAVGWQAGITLTAIAETLSRFEPLEGRLRVIATAAGVTLIDDTYNANPGSVIAAVTTLKELDPAGRKFMVLGDMLELGASARELHRELGALIAASHLDGLFVTGAMAEEVAAGALDQGMPAQQVVTAEKPVLTQKLKARLRPGDYLLIKGSRGMAMETVLKALMEWAHTPTETEAS
jgi:UDP-N-acetylmuramoyl-tripeptide--D-alanyl-D-alanine ligase